MRKPSTENCPMCEAGAPTKLLVERTVDIVTDKGVERNCVLYLSPDQAERFDTAMLTAVNRGKL